MTRHLRDLALCLAVHHRLLTSARNPQEVSVALGRERFAISPRDDGKQRGLTGSNGEAKAQVTASPQVRGLHRKWNS
jgi:hypothetical protein